MNKSKSAPRLRTQITDIATEGAKLLDRQHLRLAIGARQGSTTMNPGGGMMAEGGTCVPGTTYPSSYKNPGEVDSVTDDVYD